MTTALSENKDLAVIYQRLQNTYLNNKAALLRLVERRVNNEDSLKDHREVSSRIKKKSHKSREVLRPCL